MPTDFKRLAPPVNDLQTGDFLWVKNEHQLVLFGAASPQAQAWQSQRDAFVARTEANPHASRAERQMARQLKNLGLEAAQGMGMGIGMETASAVAAPPANSALAGRATSAALAGAALPDDVLTSMPRVPWVGHIAVVQLQGGVPWVVDATPHRRCQGVAGPSGVATQLYADWLLDDAHTQSHVWHGRLAGLNAERTAAIGLTIADAAASHMGKPYGLTPWEFGDLSHHYCSKLVWYAVSQASGIALDGQPATPRAWWFTPWDAMQSPHIQLRYSPPRQDYRG